MWFFLQKNGREFIFLFIFANAAFSPRPAKCNRPILHEFRLLLKHLGLFPACCALHSGLRPPFPHSRAGRPANGPGPGGEYVAKRMIAIEPFAVLIERLAERSKDQLVKLTGGYPKGAEPWGQLRRYAPLELCGQPLLALPPNPQVEEAQDIQNDYVCRCCIFLIEFILMPLQCEKLVQVRGN